MRRKNSESKIEELSSIPKKIEPNIGLKSKKKRGYLGGEEYLPNSLPLEVKKTKDETRDLKITNQNKAMKMLDKNIEKAVKVLVDGLEDTDKYYRYNCAISLIKKVLPDKKQLLDDPDSKNPGHSDRRNVVFNIVNFLDEIGFDDLKEKAANGSIDLFKLEPGRERSKKTSLP